MTPELPPLPYPFRALRSSSHDAWAEQMHAYAESARAPLVAEVDRLREALQIALQYVPLDGEDADAIYKLVKP